VIDTLKYRWCGKFLAALVVAFPLSTSFVCAQEQGRDASDLDAVRTLRAKEAREGQIVAFAPAPQAKIWTLSPDIAAASRGTFGIDISHYEIDGCTINNQAVAQLGLRYIYLEVTRGTGAPDNQVVDEWNKLESFHADKTLFRGAYHFLLPTDDLGVDASAQANNFLKAIGATSAHNPSQLPPVLDIEPTHTPVTQGSAEYNACTRRQQDGEKYYCDMWYKVKDLQDIATLASNWVSAVEHVTRRDVIIYSSPGAWNKVIGKADVRQLLRNRAIWIARYSSDGAPQKDPSWSTASWNSTWNMPTLLGDASYPSQIYKVPNFWQFTETGRLSQNPFSCQGEVDPFAGKLDFSFMPVRGAEFETAFGIH
jgi:GH25 family lysozyme M1 (1,4-beta-N-acetylmuramidase)